MTGPKVMDTAAPVLSKDELARAATRKLGRQIEPFVLLVQGLGVIVSANIDKFTPQQRIFMYCFALVHVALFVLVRRTPGPLTRGGAWLTLWIGAILIMPIVVATFNPPEYGKYESCTHLCSYSWPAMAMVALYPWLTVGRMIRVRTIRAVALLVVVMVEPLLITGHIEDWHLRANNYWSIVTTAIWSICGFITGIAIGYMCRTAAASQVTEAQGAYDRLFHFMHSHLDGNIYAIDLNADNPQEVHRQTREMREFLCTLRVILSAAHDPANVAPIFREAIRVYTGLLDVKTPRVGELLLPQWLILTLHRCVGDLLKNVLENCGPGTTVVLTLETSDHTVVLDVIDSGGGFSEAELDDPMNTTAILRKDLRSIGGDLIKLPSDGGGAHLRVTIPTTQQSGRDS